AVASSPEIPLSTMNLPVPDNFGQHGWADILEIGLLQIPPKGLNQGFIATAG
ncbi:hypothetical protein MMC31_005813, partial [Peltigera leucophlebia]|nr:hypothetical protein [Peltigera leucophlebia]